MCEVSTHVSSARQHSEPQRRVDRTQLAYTLSFVLLECKPIIVDSLKKALQALLAFIFFAICAYHVLQLFMIDTY